MTAMAEQAPDSAAQLQSLPMAVVMLHADRTIAAANAAAENMLEQSARRLVGRPLSEFLRFDDARIGAALDQPDTNLAAHGMRVHIGRSSVRKVDISLSPVGQGEGWQLLVLNESGAGSPLFDGDAGAEGFAVRGPDILAHEIKNPLAAIKGAAQLIERQLDGAGRRLSGLITAEVDRIALLIDQMQSLTSRTAAPMKPCNIYEPLSRVREIVETAHPDTVRFVERFDPSIPRVLADADNLVQILLNLITNAREAMDGQEGACITLTTKFVSGVRMRLSRDGSYIRLPVEVRVTDNGPGIDTGIAEDIFSPFVTTKKTGQGLGLALVQKLVRDMNGRIVHDRDTALGLTHFRLFLPLAS
ncbi:ATP-binding protein [Blastomonas sp. AAP53]|uniref:two-component system sensor histidine kinase NtrB n=1 Tax=Blastomonas sp. AAP53 TaxID=1248760 RepID=UPI0002D62B52|nr:ATP-binding protein [Blastomonas sp. AAP53]